MAGRRAGSDASAKGLTHSQPANYSVEVLRPEATELDVRSQQVHADDLGVAENALELEGAHALTSTHIRKDVAQLADSRDVIADNTR